MAYTTIDDPSAYFQTKLYTGTGSELAITGVGFQPDWVWVKQRGADASHFLYDSVRGATKSIRSNSDNAEATVAQSLKSFDSDGFTVGTSAEPNTSSGTYVGWNWKAGTSFTNDASSTGIGTIDSTGSASDTAGFSIVSYTGTGSAGTIKHGLSSVPKVILCKNRDTSENWITYHEPLGAGKFLRLNQTNAETTSSNFWNDTTPTSSVFSVATGITVNNSGDDIVAYCFAEKKGYSKFGSYTGNGNADGTFVYTGFKPAWIMIKKSSATDNWLIVDNKRNGYNGSTNGLFPDLSGTEVTNQADVGTDLVSNGFKPRGNSGFHNESGQTYIYMAFAENPFVTSTGIPTTAR